jgi:hypothetical protein
MVTARLRVDEAARAPYVSTAFTATIDRILK